MNLFIKSLLLLLVLPCIGRSQNGVYYIPSDKEFDSVRTTLAHTTNDMLRMSAYYYISSYYTELNKDTSLYYAGLQLQTARKLKQKLWEGDAQFQIAYIQFSLGNYPKSLQAVTDGLAVSYDAEGAGTIFPVYIDVAAMRATGKFTALEIKDSVIARIKNGIYNAPVPTGIGG